jgi:hypothetical protein
MHASVRVCECVRARDGDLHLGIIVQMYIIICTRARMCTCVRALVECILARGRGRGRGCARAAGAGVHELGVTTYL